jgi:hypothetical protein
MPDALVDLRAAAVAATEAVYQLHPQSGPSHRRAVILQLRALAHQAEQLTRTDCPHPDGPRDPNPDQWGDCLICNTNRRRGQRPSIRRLHERNPR